MRLVAAWAATGLSLGAHGRLSQWSMTTACTTRLGLLSIGTSLQTSDETSDETNDEMSAVYRLSCGVAQAIPYLYRAARLLSGAVPH